jgi:nitrate/nitrite-specific signal transduction histidine kinase
VIEDCQSKMQELDQIFTMIKTFLLSNNPNLELNEYYIPLGDKTFLQHLVETLTNPTIDENQREEYIGHIKNFIEKAKNLYSMVESLDSLESRQIKSSIKDGAKVLGFAGNDSELCSELENAIKRLDKEGIAL